jgi:hypothetical protein
VAEGDGIEHLQRCGEREVSRRVEEAWQKATASRTTLSYSSSASSLSHPPLAVAGEPGRRGDRRGPAH